MADDKLENLDKSIRTQRRRIEQVATDHAEDMAVLRVAVLAIAIAVAMLALTATTWMSAEDSEYDRTYVHTLWALVPEGLLGFVTLAVLVVLALGTIGMFVAHSTSRATHIVFLAIALFAALSVLLVGTVEPPGSVDAEDYDTAPGRWLTLLAAIALAVLHGVRAGELRYARH